MKRVYNFSSGPAILPLEVLKQIQEELLDFNNSGMSILEISHRSKTYDAVIKETEKDLREIMNIDSNYKILFLQGGASRQFSDIPLNLAKNGIFAYITTGQFSEKAYKEAKKYGKAYEIASSKDKDYSYIPDCSNLDIPYNADYVYICDNNTIYGSKFHTLPNTKGKPLVADVSSCFLSEEIDIENYGLVYAGAQKNAGIAGLTVVIIREDLIQDILPISVATMSHYKIQVDNESLYNTPPTFSIYVFGKVLKWIKSVGGLKEIQKRNVEKAKLLYDYLDKSKLFIPLIRKDSRSMMNVTFKTTSDELDTLFCMEAKKEGLVDLKGHRSVGGIRASIYNAMPIEGVKKLVEFMKKFEDSVDEDKLIK